MAAQIQCVSGKTWQPKSIVFLARHGSPNLLCYWQDIMAAQIYCVSGKTLWQLESIVFPVGRLWNKWQLRVLASVWWIKETPIPLPSRQCAESRCLYLPVWNVRRPECHRPKQRVDSIHEFDTLCV